MDVIKKSNICVHTQMQTRIKLINLCANIKKMLHLNVIIQLILLTTPTNWLLTIITPLSVPLCCCHSNFCNWLQKNLSSFYPFVWPRVSSPCDRKQQHRRQRTTPLHLHPTINSPSRRLRRARHYTRHRK